MNVVDARKGDLLPVGVAAGAGALVGAESVAKVATRLYDKLLRERERCARIDTWLVSNQELPEIPEDASREMKRLLRLARTPWLGLVVTTLAQAMYVDGYKSPKGETVAGAWSTWNANSMQTRQVAVHRAALSYGHSFVLTEKGLTGAGESRSVMRGFSPKRMVAEYDDPSFDEWPVHALRLQGTDAPVSESAKTVKVWLYDDTFAHLLQHNPSKNSWVVLKSTPHGAGVVPVTRYANQLDLEGNSLGEVEPFIGVAQRIDKSVYDRLVTQHYNSWKKMWISGLTEPPATEEDARRKKLKLRQDDILIAESTETKFGAIPETDLAGFISAIEADIESLAAVAQLPNHLLTGKMVNLSADALSSARAPLVQKVYERQVSFGVSHSQALRLAAKLQGEEIAGDDVLSHVTWQDTEVRSLAQAADALGKLATQLGIPRKVLWGRIPGVTQTDVKEWEEELLSDDPETVWLRDTFDKKAGGSPGGGEDRSGPTENLPDWGGGGVQS